MIDGKCKKLKKKFFQKLSFNFSETGSANLHSARHWHASTARISLKLVADDRLCAERNTQVASEQCSVQMTDADFEDDGVQVVEKKIEHQFYKLGFAHPCTARYQHASPARTA